MVSNESWSGMMDYEFCLEDTGAVHLEANEEGTVY